MLPTTYNAGQQPSPPVTKTAEVVAGEETQVARQNNLVWMMGRLLQAEDQSMSSWTGFNIVTRRDVTVNEDNIGYVPTINAAAIHMSTVNEVLKQTLSIQKSLGLKNIVRHSMQKLSRLPGRILKSSIASSSEWVLSIPCALFWRSSENVSKMMGSKTCVWNQG